jgi:parallel beta-helix repeat protein
MMSFLDSVVTSTGASNVSFVNMTVSIAKQAVITAAGDGTRISGSTVSNAGSACLSVHGNGLSVDGNTVFGCGGAGIVITSGDVKTLVSGKSEVVGNTIRDFSLKIRTYQPGIAFFSCVGLRVAYNNVSNGPHTAMTGGGNDMLFEHNRISKVCYECTDTGAFYVGRSWSQRGNIARYNTFDTIRPTERLAQKSCSQNAFYLDDEMSGWTFTGNTIINSTTGVLLGGGRRNTISNNTFIANDVDIAFDGRGLTWQTGYCRANCTDVHGVVQPSCFRDELEGLKYTEPPYSTAYPELVKIFEESPCVPVYNAITDNRYCHTESHNGGKFITASNATIASWKSTISGNKEQC